MKTTILKVLTLASSVLVAFACSHNEGNNEPSVSSISVKAIQIDAKAGTYSTSFTITGKASAKDVSVTSDADWISDITVGESEISFQAKENAGDTRTAHLSVTLGSNEPVKAAVVQNFFDFDAFSISVSDITSSSCTATINPKSYKGNYYFMVMSKSSVDSYLALDTHSLGDMEYGDALFQSDILWLKTSAQAAEKDFASFIVSNTAFYKTTTTGASTIMPYGSRSPLSYNTDYYLVVYGLDTDGNRTTPIAFREFRTLDIQRSNITFKLTADHITPNSASVTITPSNDDTYFWTYISEMEYAKLDKDKDEVLSNMIANMKTYIATYGGSMSQYLIKGAHNETIDQLWSGTKYYVIAWGMDDKGNQTTDAMEIGTFTTEGQKISDDCRFGISVTATTPIDYQIKVVPTKASTRYYIAPVAKSLTSGYDKYQFAQRIINMQTQRYENSDVNWSNDESSIFTGTVSKWANGDLGWVVRPSTKYAIFVFGVAADGTRVTDVDTLEYTTPKSQETSEMTFNVKFDNITWRSVSYTISPSVSNERYLPFVIETKEIDDNGLRKSDGSLEDEAIFEAITEYYSEDGQYAMDYASRRGTQTLEASAGIYSEHKYSLLLFGYSGGAKTTKIYEYQFTTPAIPFDKSDAEVSLETFEFFEGEDLYQLDNEKWKDYRTSQIIHIVIKPNDKCKTYYAGMWPPESHWSDVGGRDYIVKLVQMANIEGDNIYAPQTDKTFGGVNYGFFEEKPWTTPDGKTTVSAVPWEFIWYGEGEDGNYGHYNYKYFVLRPANYTIKDGDVFDIKPSKAYNFWSGKGTSAVAGSTFAVDKKTGATREVRFK